MNPQLEYSIGSVPADTWRSNGRFGFDDRSGAFADRFGALPAICLPKALGCFAQS